MAKDFTATVTEFSHASEAVTAHVLICLNTGESVTDPILIGFCPDDDPELWIEQDGRVQFPASALAEIIKQLRRAARLAKDGGND